MARRAHREAAGLSLGSARRLVEGFGHEAVGQGLDLLKRRPGVINPAGFLITYMRSTCKVYYDNITKDVRPDSAEWVRQMAASPYVTFLANAGDFARIESQCEDG
jgi:hypothetical protein